MSKTDLRTEIKQLLEKEANEKELLNKEEKTKEKKVNNAVEKTDEKETSVWIDIEDAKNEKNRLREPTERGEATVKEEFKMLYKVKEDWIKKQQENPYLYKDGLIEIFKNKKLTLLTFTFGEEWRKKDQMEKIKALNKMVSQLKNRKTKEGKIFDYYWVCENGIIEKLMDQMVIEGQKGEHSFWIKNIENLKIASFQKMKKMKNDENIHFHLIVDWDFTYNWLIKYWNKILGGNSENKMGSLNIKKLEEESALPRVIEYIMKEMYNESYIFGWSINVKRQMTEIYTKKGILIETPITDFYEKPPDYYLQKQIELKLCDDYLKLSTDYNLINLWLKKLIKTEKISEKFNATFMAIWNNWTKRKKKSSDKNNSKSQAINNYFKKVSKNAKVENRDKIVINKMVKPLLYFYIENGFYQHTMRNQEFIDKLTMILYCLAYDLKKEAKKKVLITSTIEYIEILQYITMDVEAWIDINLNEYFKKETKLDFVGNHEVPLVYVRLIKDFNNIPLNKDLKKLSKLSPLVYKPKDWTSKKWGGFISNGISFFLPIAKYNDENMFTFLKNSSYKSINNLQKIQYRINVNLLNFIIINKTQIFKRCYKGIDLEELPELIKQAEIDIRLANKKDSPLHKDLGNLIKKKEDLISQLTKRRLQERILEEAKIYSEYDHFYYTYQVDFRGRIYPLADNLNYQGEQLAKVLVYFKRESKMNLYWFKIYAARNYGLPAYVNTANKILQYFDDYLSKKMITFEYDFFWLDCDEPWIFLNCCIEYKKYLHLGDANYTTGMPIYLDATCSGSQLIHLLFRLNEYAVDLNLVKKTADDIIGDLYIKMIFDYREYLKKNKENYLKW